jgi:hypothetical protein
MFEGSPRAVLVIIVPMVRKSLKRSISFDYRSHPLIRGLRDLAYKTQISVATVLSGDGLTLE